MVSGGIRIIGYEVLTWAELDLLGDLRQHVKDAMGITP
jgi:hypothetical protein